MRRTFTLSVWNSALVGVVAVGFSLGIVQPVFTTDWTGITYILGFILAVGLVCNFRSAWIIDQDRRASGHQFSSFWVTFPQYAGKIAVLLGFLGTIVGLSYLIQNIPTNALGGDPAVLFGTVMEHVKIGLSPAFYTTMVGVIVRLWLSSNYYVSSL